MKRIIASTFIVAYVTILTCGNLCHTLQFQTGSHPLMYLIVWDMFCGWSAYANDIHIIAEGESERYYRLAPGPWGAYKPWGGDFARHSYDSYYNHLSRMARNTLDHTRHEKIARIFVVEETWPKKYDLPEAVWRHRYGDQPKDVQRYCRVRIELAPDGQPVRHYASWYNFVYLQQLSSNPRLHTYMQRSRPMFVVDPSARREFSSPVDGDRTAAGPGSVEAQVFDLTDAGPDSL